MRYLVDTNILLRFVSRIHPQHEIVRIAVRRLHSMEHEFHTTSQNCVEFWNVATRPAAKNGFGLKTVEAGKLLQLVERLFPLLADSIDIYPEWKQIVASFNVSGVQVHDARLVAAMKVHGMGHILTFNTSDYARYATSGIIAVDPSTV